MQTTNVHSSSPGRPRSRSSDGRPTRLEDAKLRSQGSLPHLLPLKPKFGASSHHHTDPEYHVPEPALLARGFVEGINTANFDHPSFKYHIAPEFRATNDNFSTPTPWAQYLETYRILRHQNPGFRLNIMTESVDMNVRQDKATVWQFARITGFPEGVQRDNLGMSRWRMNDEGRWLCYAHAGYRSWPGFATS